MKLIIEITEKELKQIKEKPAEEHSIAFAEEVFMKIQDGIVISNDDWKSIKEER